VPLSSETVGPSVPVPTGAPDGGSVLLLGDVGGAFSVGFGVGRFVFPFLRVGAKVAAVFATVGPKVLLLPAAGLEVGTPFEDAVGLDVFSETVGEGVSPGRLVGDSLAGVVP